MEDYFIACTHFPLTAENALVAAKVVRLNLEDRDKPVFLAGDLNSLPESEPIAELEKGLMLISDVSKYTFRADNPDRTIDYIFADKKHSDRVTVLENEVIAAPEATDHCALVTTIELK
jgi:endonuclease/exonuclease/phosphatase family metal-dependent hydrolase